MGSLAVALMEARRRSRLKLQLLARRGVSQAQPGGPKQQLCLLPAQSLRVYPLNLAGCLLGKNQPEDAGEALKRRPTAAGATESDQRVASERERPRTCHPRGSDVPTARDESGADASSLFADAAGEE